MSRTLQLAEQLISRPSITPEDAGCLEMLADRLAAVALTHQPASAVRYGWPALPVRNLAFLLIVLGHGFRRLLPPY